MKHTHCITPCPRCGSQFRRSRQDRRRAFPHSPGGRKRERGEAKSGVISTASLLSILLQQIASSGLCRILGIIPREAEKALTSSRFSLPIGMICSDGNSKRSLRCAPGRLFHPLSLRRQSNNGSTKPVRPWEIILSKLVSGAGTTCWVPRRRSDRLPIDMT